MTLPAANVTANGGTSGADVFLPHPGGAAGTVYFSTTPYFTWEGVDGLLHGTETITWAGLGLDPTRFTADVSAYQAQQALPFAVGQPVVGSYAWNTTAVPDGQAELRVVFHDASGNVVGQATRQVLVNNSAAWHAGTITADQTWASDRVHIVEGPVTIPAGVTVTIQPGAVVKFAHGTGITVLGGGTLDASQATQAAPIIFTSLADDTAGGDTNRDGNKTLPLAGDWTGIGAQGGGAFSSSSYTFVRYLVTAHSGTLSANEAWDGTFTHHVTGDVTIPGGITLTINPGAVVKFDAGTGIVVQAGGRLIADGTVAQPIVFTSIRDDSAGGDTNQDGGASLPAPGDWHSLLVNGGELDLDHAQVLYAGWTANGSWDATAGAISNNSGGIVTIADSQVRDALYDALIDWGSGSLTATNTVITSCDRGLDPDGTSVNKLLNCTLDNNRIGIWGHNGYVEVTNTIISDSLQAGIDNVLRSPITVRHSDVWSAIGSNYAGNMSDPTGQNGNLSADPRYKNAAQGDYRLNYLSPVIDAADGAAAPPPDLMGAPRYNDPRTSPKKGVPDANGNYPDMGAFEFVESAPSDIDFVVTSVTGPSTATVGDRVTLHWAVSNIGSGLAVGPWYDRISLVPEAGAAVSAAEVLVGQGVTLGPGASYDASAEVVVPGAVAGAYHWQVRTNSRDTLFEGKNRDNNTTNALAPVAVTVPQLALGVPAAGTLTGSDSSYYYVLPVSAGEDYLLSLADAKHTGTNELDVALGRLPSRTDFDARGDVYQAADQHLSYSASRDGLLYVLVYGEIVPDAPAPFTLTASRLEYSLTGVSPASGGNAGPVTVAIYGGRLDPASTARLVAPGQMAVNATGVYWVNSGLLYFTFDLTGQAVGQYDVQVVRPDQTVASLPGGFTVVPGIGPDLRVYVTGQPTLRAGTGGTIWVTATNTGTNDSIVPIAVLDVPPGYTVGQGRPSVAIDLRSPDLPVAVLPPGGTVKVPLAFTAATDAGGYDWVLRWYDYPAATNDGVVTSTWTGTDGKLYADTQFQWSETTNETRAVFTLTPYKPTPVVSPSDDFKNALSAFPVQPGLPGWRYTYQDQGSPTSEESYRVWRGKAFSNDLWSAGADLSIHSEQESAWIQVITSANYPGLTPTPRVDPLPDYWIRSAADWLPFYYAQKTDPTCRATYFYDTPSIPLAYVLEQAALAEDGCYTYSFRAETHQADWNPQDLSYFPPPSSPIQVHVTNAGYRWGYDVEGCIFGGKGELFPQRVSKAADPNQMVPPAGFGADQYVAADAPLPYAIDFENDPQKATAPAQQVHISNPLDSNLDPSTFQLTDIAFGSHTMAVPAGLKYYTTTADLRPEGQNLLVKVQAGLDPTTNTVTWDFVSLDPDTGLPIEDPLAGFLPVDDASHRGEGSVSYTIRPRAGLPTGTPIHNGASIVFDVNAPLATNDTLNTLDAGKPTSRVADLPAVTTTADFTVSWSGADDGSGIGSYNVFVSDSDGPFTPWQTATTDTSAVYHGEFGHTYAFFSEALDNVGHIQADPKAAGVATTLLVAPPTSSVNLLPAITTTASFPVSWSGSPGAGAHSIAAYDVFVSSDGGPFSPFLTGTAQTSATFPGAFGHSYGFYSMATDDLGTRQLVPTGPQATTLVVASPTSSVNSLPAFSPATIPVSWSGTPGAGGHAIAAYDVYVSTDVGPFAAFLTGTAQTSASFAGTSGHTYAFYSVATDDLGTRQATPPAAQASTQVDAVPPTSSVAALPPTVTTLTFTITWSGQDDPGGSGVATFDIFVSDNGGPFAPFLTGTVQTSSAFTGQVGHTYGFFSVATDKVGNVQALPTAAQATTTVQDVSAPTWPAGSQLQAADVQATSLTLTWTAAQDDVAVTAYRVFQGSTLLASTDAGTFTATVTALQPATASTFHVEAVDAAGNQSSTGPAVTLTTAAPPVSDPLTAYVTQLYRDVLGREPEAFGRAVWLGQLQGGASRTQVAAGIWQSVEHRGQQVDQFYATYLHRPAEAAGRAFWVNRLLEGTSETDVAAGFLTSAEYTLQHPDTAAFLHGVYADVLGRAPDAVGLAYWPAVADQAPDGRLTTARRVLTSVEPDMRVLDAYYAGYLGRHPDVMGVQDWMARMQSGSMTPAEVAVAILASDECFARIGGAP
jgi:hypothetical protein